MTQFAGTHEGRRSAKFGLDSHFVVFVFGFVLVVVVEALRLVVDLEASSTRFRFVGIVKRLLKRWTPTLPLFERCLVAKYIAPVGEGTQTYSRPCEHEKK